MRDPCSVFTPPDTEIPKNGYRVQWESVLMSVSINYEHLHIITCKSVSASVNNPRYTQRAVVVSCGIGF